MKKLFSLLLSFIILVSSCQVVFSATDTSIESLLTLVKSRLPDTSDFENFDSDSYTDNNSTVYQFNWSTSSTGSYKSMYATASKSGIILEYGLNDNTLDETSSPKFDRISTEEALRKTQVLIKRLNPTIAHKLSVKADDAPDSFNSNRLYFDVIHEENGIPVMGDTGRVSVDINAEKIYSFRIKFTENLSYSPNKGLISEADAKKAFTKNIGLESAYRVYRNTKDRKTSIFPIYTPNLRNKYIDAYTGKAIEVIPVAQKYFEYSSDSVGGTNSSNRGDGFTEAERLELERIDELLSEEETEELLRSIPLLAITDSYKVSSSSLNKVVYEPDSYIRSVVFVNEKDGKSNFIHTNSDAKTGELLSYSCFNDIPTETTPLERDILKQKAEELLTCVAGEKKSEYILSEKELSSDGYFTYERYKNGLLVSGDTIAIELSPANGTLVSYNINYTKGEFPDISRIMSGDKICLKFFEHTDYYPMYIPYKSETSLANADKTALVYVPEDTSIILDAYTGNRITYDGKPYQKEAELCDYEDIEGHFAQEKIQNLHRFGIGFEGKKFLPDTEITQKELIALVVKGICTQSSITISPDMDFDEYYTLSEKFNLLTEAEKAPDLPVSRINAAKIICRALDAEKYAKIDKMFACPFADVTDGKGYATLLWGMNIINGTSDSTYSPNDFLTRAQAAVILYNTMNVM